MASPAVHNKEGKECSICCKPFDKTSMTLSIRKREMGFITRKMVCGVCYEDFYGGGE